MGLLDDAIREHLELKRKHGASDEEIEQEEAEALGPARRDFPVQPASEVAAAETIVDEAPEPAPDEPGTPSTEPFDPFAKEALAPTTIDEPELPPEPEPAPFEDAPATEEGEEEPPPAKDSDDVLEDTPEFLQDAPEHDRLWFEQKPPRDFDFD